jgi:hypothetical protein
MSQALFLRSLIFVAALFANHRAFAAESLCSFLDQEERKITLFQAFAQVTKYYSKAPDVDFVLIGCRNQEVATKDTTYGLLERHNLPSKRDGVEVLFVFFVGFQDGHYQFSLDTSDDPWMDGSARVDARYGRLNPLYNFHTSF